MLESKYYMYLVQNKNFNTIKIFQNGKLIPDEVAQKMYNFHRQIKQFTPLLMLLMIVICQEFFLHFFFKQWSNRIRDYMMLFVIITYFFYGCFCNLFMVNYYYMTVRYIRFKQNHLKKQVDNLTTLLNSKMKGKFSRYEQPKVASNWQYYQQFELYLHEILALFDEIKGIYNIKSI